MQRKEPEVPNVRIPEEDTGIIIGRDQRTEIGNSF